MAPQAETTSPTAAGGSIEEQAAAAVGNELTLAVTGLSKGQTASFEREELQMPAAEGEEPPPPRQREFDIEIPDDDAEKLKTVADAIDYIGSHAS